MILVQKRQNDRVSTLAHHDDFAGAGILENVRHSLPSGSKLDRVQKFETADLAFITDVENVVVQFVSPEVSDLKEAGAVDQSELIRGRGVVRECRAVEGSVVLGNRVNTFALDRVV